MRRRLYFVLPNLEVAKAVHNELLLDRVEEDHMHFVGKEGVPLEGLPEATVFQKSDFVHAMQTGLAIGAVAGVLLGLLGALLGLSPAGREGMVVLVLVLAGAVFGAIAASLIGLYYRNTRLGPLWHDVDEGHVLLMVEVGKERVDEVTEMIKQHHPDADAHGIEPTIPAFP